MACGYGTCYLRVGTPDNEQVQLSTTILSFITLNGSETPTQTPLFPFAVMWYSHLKKKTPLLWKYGSVGHSPASPLYEHFQNLSLILENQPGAKHE